MNFKNIHIGILIAKRVTESNVEILRICNFLKCNEEEISQMYQSKSLDTETLLKWSKLLKYDFFRLYSQHLILYAPSDANLNLKQTSFSLPKFKKNIYTREIIDFILELLDDGTKTKQEVINDYNIPKTTLYKWISKYSQKAE